MEKWEEQKEKLKEEPEQQPGENVVEKCEEKLVEERKENEEEKLGEEEVQEQPAGEGGETLAGKQATEEEAGLKETPEIEPQKADQPEEVQTSPAKEEENRSVSPQTTTLAPSPVPEPSFM